MSDFDEWFFKLKNNKKNIKLRPISEDEVKKERDSILLQGKSRLKLLKKFLKRIIINGDKNANT